MVFPFLTEYVQILSPYFSLNRELSSEFNLFFGIYHCYKNCKKNSTLFLGKLRYFAKLSNSFASKNKEDLIFSQKTLLKNLLVNGEIMPILDRMHYLTKYLYRNRPNKLVLD